MIREYPIELGDNPACSAGAPIQIGWDPQDISLRNLEVYEYCRQDRRRGKQLVLSVPRRAQLLMEAGYSIEQIGTATYEVEVVQKSRAETLQNQGWDRVNVFLEATGKLPKEFLNGVLGGLKKVAGPAPVKKMVRARSA